MIDYKADEGRNGLGCGLAAVWLVLAIPLFLVAMLGGGGCEAKPQPCKPSWWSEYALLAGIIVLAIATGWSTKRLRNARKGPLWWVALVLAVSTAAVAVFALYIDLAILLGWPI